MSRRALARGLLWCLHPRGQTPSQPKVRGRASFLLRDLRYVLPHTLLVSNAHARHGDATLDMRTTCFGSSRSACFEEDNSQ
jgi:hypothetical protein